MGDKAGTDQRFHHIAQHVVAVTRAIVIGLLAEQHMRAKLNLAGDGGTGRAADQRIEPLRKAALVARAQLMEPFGDRQSQHPVAEEFEPLVVARVARAAMGQRLAPNGFIDRVAAGKVDHERARCRLDHPLRTCRRCGSSVRRRTMSTA